MTLNPIQRLRERSAAGAAEQAYEEHGWGTHLSFWTTRRDGQKLVFQMRLPDGMEMVDVIKLAQSARGAPAFVGQAATALEQAKDQAGVITVGALRPTEQPENERPIVATLTVALTEVDGDVNIEDFLPRDSPSTLQSKQDLLKMSDKVTRVHRLSSESQGEGKDPLPMLMIEYLYHTRYGMLAMAFTTPRMDMMGGFAIKLFEQIFESGYIGESPTAF